MRKHLLICTLLVAAITTSCAKSDTKSTTIPEAVVSVSTKVVDANGNEKTTTTAKETANETTTAAETTAAAKETSPAATNDLDKLEGQFDGSNYLNPFFGIGVTVDDNWKISMDDDLFNEWKKQDYFGKYTDFWSTNSSTGTSLIFYIGKDETASDIFTYAPDFCKQYKLSLEKSGYTVKDYKDAEISIGDKTYPYTYMTAEKDGKAPLSWGIVLMYKDEFVFDIEAVGKTEDDVINCLKMISLK